MNGGMGGGKSETRAENGPRTEEGKREREMVEAARRDAARHCNHQAGLYQLTLK